MVGFNAPGNFADQVRRASLSVRDIFQPGHQIQKRVFEVIRVGIEAAQFLRLAEVSILAASLVEGGNKHQEAQICLPVTLLVIQDSVLLADFAAQNTRHASRGVHATVHRQVHPGRQERIEKTRSVAHHKKSRAEKTSDVYE